MISTFRKILDLLDTRMRWRLAGLATLLLVSGMLEFVGVGLLLPFFQAMVGDTSTTSSTAMQLLLGFVSLFTPHRDLIAIGLVLFGVIAVKNLLLGVATYLQGRLNYSSQATLANRLFDIYLRMPWEQHLQRNSADAIHRIISAIPAVFTGSLLAFLRIAAELVQVGAAIAALVWLEPFGSMLASSILAAALALHYLCFRRRIGAWGREREEIQARRIRLVKEGIGAVKEIKTLGCEDHFTKTFARESNRDADLNSRINIVTQSPRLMSEVVLLAAIFAVIAVLAGRGLAPTEILPSLGVMAVVALRLLPGFNRITSYAADIRQRQAAVENVHADWRRARTAADRPVTASASGLKLQHTIEVDNVTYRYPAASALALANVTLTVRKGEALALVGPSGAGKTTLVDIMLGLLTPGEGRLLVDGLAITEPQHIQAWRSGVSYVPQGVFLVDDTLRRNIAFGVPDAEIDNARVTRAVELAQLTSVVRDLPQGLDARVGEHGVRLSGGQRQRIGIARALYRDKQVLILDEITSALDEDTEGRVADAIQNLKGHCTIIVISHRPGTMAICDRVVRLSGGRIEADSAPRVAGLRAATAGSNPSR